MTAMQTQQFEVKYTFGKLLHAYEQLCDRSTSSVAVGLQGQAMMQSRQLHVSSCVFV